MASPQTIVLIRHGEKPGQGGAPHGVNRHGEQDEHSLSVRGWTRAGALAAVFAKAPYAADPVLHQPTRVFATRPTHADRSTRERDTAMPTALRLGLAIDDSLAHGNEVALATLVLAEPGNSLVVWHHGELADLARAFPLDNPSDVPERWPDDRFDLYWILTQTSGAPESYRFSVVPQLLLDGDTP